MEKVTRSTLKKHSKEARKYEDFKSEIWHCFVHCFLLKTALLCVPSCISFRLRLNRFILSLIFSALIALFIVFSLLPYLYRLSFCRLLDLNFCPLEQAAWQPREGSRLVAVARDSKGDKSSDPRYARTDFVRLITVPEFNQSSSSNDSSSSSPRSSSPQGPNSSSSSSSRRVRD